MPRKQRFKPSRKPKPNPNPQNEEAPIGHQSHPNSNHDSAYARDSYAAGENPPVESGLDPQSR